MKFGKRSFYGFLAVLAITCISATALAMMGRDSLQEHPFLSEGVAPHAVVAHLSQIPQETERKFNPETWNANEEDAEEWMRQVQSLNVIPQVIPQHFDRRDVPQKAHSVQAADSVPAPSVNRITPGLSNTGDGQPDSIIAVGPSHYMLAVNTNVAIYTRGGQRRFITSFDHWFAPLDATAGGSTLFDPRLLYDQYAHHYVFLCTSRRSDHRSWILLSVSKTSNPEGDWAFWALDLQLNGNARTNLWADFPRLGVDQNALYVTANMYTFGSYIFRYSKIRVLRKSDLYAFGALPYYEFRQMIDATGAYAHSIEPAHSYGNAPAEFLVNTRVDAASKITLWKLTTPVTGNPTLARISVPVSSYMVPPLALQKGGGAVINTATEGTGVLSVFYRNGFIHTVHPVAKDWGSGKVSALRYYQMKTTGQVVQEITYGTDGVYYYMPSLAVDGRGNVVIAFSRSSATEFAGFYIAGRKSAQPAGQLSNSIPLQAGLANYTVVFRGSNIGRWGDYNGIAVAGDNTFWAFGQYTANATQWQTVVGQLSY